MLQNLSSAAVVIGALRVKHIQVTYLCPFSSLTACRVDLLTLCMLGNFTCF